MKTVKIALDVPEDHFYTAMVRRVGRTLLEHHHAVPQDIDDVETVVGELCTNVTHHARSEAGRYHVTLEHCGSHLVVMVADQGQGFDPDKVLPIGEPREDTEGGHRYGGFGLHLVRTLSDRVDIQPSEPCGTTVRAEKKFLPHPG